MSAQTHSWDKNNAGPSSHFPLRPSSSQGDSRDRTRPQPQASPRPAKMIPLRGAKSSPATLTNPAAREHMPPSTCNDAHHPANVDAAVYAKSSRHLSHVATQPASSTSGTPAALGDGVVWSSAALDAADTSPSRLSVSTPTARAALRYPAFSTRRQQASGVGSIVSAGSSATELNTPRADQENAIRGAPTMSSTLGVHNSASSSRPRDRRRPSQSPSVPPRNNSRTRPQLALNNITGRTTNTPAPGDGEPVGADPSQSGKTAGTPRHGLRGSRNGFRYTSSTQAPFRASSLSGAASHGESSSVLLDIMSGSNGSASEQPTPYASLSLSALNSASSTTHATPTPSNPSQQQAPTATPPARRGLAVVDAGALPTASSAAATPHDSAPLTSLFSLSQAQLSTSSLNTVTPRNGRHSSPRGSVDSNGFSPRPDVWHIRQAPEPSAPSEAVTQRTVSQPCRKPAPQEKKPSPPPPASSSPSRRTSQSAQPYPRGRQAQHTARDRRGGGAASAAAPAPRSASTGPTPRRSPADARLPFPGSRRLDEGAEPISLRTKVTLAVGVATAAVAAYVVLRALFVGSAPKPTVEGPAAAAPVAPSHASSPDAVVDTHIKPPVTLTEASVGAPSVTTARPMAARASSSVPSLAAAAGPVLPPDVVSPQQFTEAHVAHIRDRVIRKMRAPDAVISKE